MLVVELLVLAALILLGALITRSVLREPAWLDYVSLSLPLGGGVFSWLLFLMSLAQIPLVRSSVAAAYLASVAGLLVLGVRSGWWKTAGERRTAGWWGRRASVLPRRQPLALLIGTLCSVLLLASAALAVGRSYSRFDAMAGWSVKGYGIALEGTVEAADRWGTWGRAYPLNLPLQIALFWWFDGDQLPGSKLLFPLLFASVLAGLYRFWREQGVGPTVAGLGVLFLLTNPLAFLHSTLGVSNLPFAVFLTLGTLWLVRGVFADVARYRWAGGIMLAIASWTRAEGIGYCLAIVAGLWIAIRLLKAGRFGRLNWLLPVAAVALTWFGFSLRGVASSHLGSAAGGFIQGLLAGQFNARYLTEIVLLYAQRGFAPSNLGFLFPVMALLLVVGFWRWRPGRNPLVSALLGTAAIAAVAPVGLFYARSFTRWVDFTDLLTRSFDRATLPAIFLFVAAAILLVGHPQASSATTPDAAPSSDRVVPSTP